MKFYKQLRKRGLALFMALVMCLSMISTTAFATENEAEPVEVAVTEALTGSAMEGGADAPDASESSQTEGTVMETETVAVPVEEPVDVEEPAEVQEFLAACEAMGDADDEASILAVLDGIVAVYNRMSPEGQAAVADQWAYVQRYAASVNTGNLNDGINMLSSGYTPVTNVGIYPDRKPAFGAATADGKTRYSNQSLTMKVGQKASFLLGVPTNTLMCPSHGYVFATYNPSDYCDISLIDNSGENLVGNPTYAAGTNNGERVFDTIFEALKPGTSNDVRVCYYCNFGIVFTNGANSGSLYCPYSNYGHGHNVTVYKNTTWYRYNDVFGITVNADYVLNYDANGGSVNPTSETRTVASTECTFNLPTPTRAGYTFKGWADSKDATSGDTGTYILNWEEGYGSEANPVSKTLYAVWEAEKAPEAPKREDLNGLLGNFVEVVCVSKDDDGKALHSPKTYCTVGEHQDVTIGEVVKTATGGYTCTLTLFGATYANFYSFASDTGTGVTHTLAEDEAATQTVTLTWDATNKEWTSGEDQGTVLATFRVKCEAPKPQNPKLTKLEKVRLTEDPSDAALDLKGVTVNYDQNVIFVGDNAANVTLLYKITVTGTAGAKYKVTDEGATHVGGDPLTGVIGEGKTTAVIYVTKTFSKDDVKNGTLTNNAKLESNDPVSEGNPSGTEGPSGGNGDASGEAGASKKHTVTINFKTDDGTELQKPSVTEVDEGGNFNYGGVEQPTVFRMMRTMSADNSSDVTAVVIPQRLGDYVLDEVLSADGLKELENATNITADVIANIIYSLDVKGTIGTDDEGNLTDTYDNIPDKYQAKVIYTAVPSTGGSVSKTVEYVTLKDEQGNLVQSGTISVSDTATPNDGYTFDQWTAERGTNKVELTGTTDNAVLNATISGVQGGKSYTVVAHFAVEDTYTLTVKVMTDTDEEIIPAETKTLGTGEAYAFAETDTQVKVGVPGTPNWFTWNKQLSLQDDAGDNYSYDRTTEDTDDDGNVTITVIYSLDNIVEPSKDLNGEEPGDGIPDKYQVVVKYVSADEDQGVVKGSTVKVVTLINSRDKYQMTGFITPGTDGVTPEPATGYAFDKWDPDPTTGMSVTGGETYVFTAYFKQIKHTVTFVNGTSSTVKQEVADGEKATKPDDPTRDNHVFKGWVKEDGTPWDFDTPVTEDITLKATWAEKMIVQWVKGYDSATSATIKSITIAVDADYSGEYPTTAPTREGYTFTGWSDPEESAAGDGQKVLTITAQWTQNMMIVQWVRGYGSATSATIKSITIAVDEDYTNEYPATNPTRVGYHFIGWSEPVESTAGDGQKVVTITAQWDKEKMIVQWVKGYGSATSATIKHITIAVDADYAGEYPADPEREDYVFTGWSKPEESTAGDGQKMLTITAQWAEDKVGNNGPDGIPDMYQVKVTFQVQNGLWSNGTQTDKVIYLEKYAADGKTYAVDGSAKVAATLFPRTDPALPFEGYKADGAWTCGGVSVKATTQSVTEASVFVYTYTPKGEMTVEAQGYEGTYDGQWHEPIASLTIKDAEGNVIALNDSKLSISYDVEVEEIKDVQEKTIVITVGHKDYETVYVTVTAKITPATLAVTTDSASKPYDGNPLTASGVVNGLVNGETVTLNVTGSQTAEGSSSNTYTLTWDGTAKESNYTVTAELGTLTVTEAEVTVTWVDSITGDPVDTWTGPVSEIPTNDPAAPAHAGWIFNGWVRTEGPDGSITVTAIYRRPNITWTNGYNGGVIATGAVNQDGTYPANPAAPTRPGYIFDGWAVPVADANGDLTIAATWNYVFPVDPGFTFPIGGTTITPAPTPAAPAPTTTIDDDDVPLANAVGLNDTEHFAYIIGYDDGTVRPLNNITRAEAVTIFFRLMTDEHRAANWSTTNSFSDVNVGNWFNNAVSTCLKAGVLEHFAEDDAFLPNKAITRAEFATIAAGFVSDEITGENVGDFKDTEGHWAAEAIRKAVEAGWITGVGGNRFNPDATITRAEAMTMINRMLDRTADKDHMLSTMKKWTDNPESAWYYEAVQEATNGHGHERDEMSVESWTELMDARDWKALETEWANNGGVTVSKTDSGDAE